MKTFNFYTKLTGTSIVLMTIIAGVIMSNIFLVLFSLDAKGIENYLNSSSSYELGVVGWVIILILDILVSIGVYKIYKNVNKSISMISMFLRLIYSLILGVAIIYLFVPLFSDNTNLYLESLNTFQKVWGIGLFIFGFHLITLSKLVCDNKWLNKLLSILIFIAGIGYILTNSLEYISIDFIKYKSKLEMIFMLPMVLGELGWGISLFFKKYANS